MRWAVALTAAMSADSLSAEEVAVEELTRTTEQLFSAYNEERGELASSLSTQERAQGKAPLTQTRQTPCQEPHPQTSGSAKPKLAVNNRALEEVYPASSKHALFEGRTVIDASVSANGCAEQAAVYQSSGVEELDDAALRWPLQALRGEVRAKRAAELPGLESVAPAAGSSCGRAKCRRSGILGPDRADYARAGTPRRLRASAAACRSRRGGPSALFAQHHREAVGFADHRPLVGDLIARIVGPAQHIALCDEGEATLLEVAPRVFLVDAVDPAGIGRPGAGLGGVIDEQQHPTWLHDAGDLVEGGMRIDLRPRALGRHPVQVVSESRWRSSALRRA